MKIVDVDHELILRLSIPLDFLQHALEVVVVVQQNFPLQNRLLSFQSLSTRLGTLHLVLPQVLFLSLEELLGPIFGLIRLCRQNLALLLTGAEEIYTHPLERQSLGILVFLQLAPRSVAAIGLRNRLLSLGVLSVGLLGFQIRALFPGEGVGFLHLFLFLLAEKGMQTLSVLDLLLLKHRLPLSVEDQIFEELLQFFPLLLLY